MPMTKAVTAVMANNTEHMDQQKVGQAPVTEGTKLILQVLDQMPIMSQVENRALVQPLGMHRAERQPIATQAKYQIRKIGVKKEL